MTDSTALAVHEAAPAAAAVVTAGPPALTQPRTLAELRQYAEIMVASGYCKDVKSVAQAVTKMIAGLAQGYDPMTAMNAFHIIEGKLSLTAGEVSARIKRSGKYRQRSWFIDAEGNRIDPTKPNAQVNAAVVEILERVDDTWEALDPSVFTKQDAIVAGVGGKQVWKAYLRNMLYARALTNAARWHCADVFGGPVYTPEELGANVDVIDGEMVVVDATAPGAQPAPAKPMSGFELTALYAEARQMNPDLPADVKVWMATAVEGYAPPNNPTGRMMLDAEARLRAMLSEGATPGENRAVLDAEAAAPTEHPQSSTGALEGQETPAAPNPGLLCPPCLGPPLLATTRARLFATLGELSIRDKQPRLRWASAYEARRADGSPIASFADLSDEQGRFLADRAAEELNAWRVNSGQA